MLRGLSSEGGHALGGGSPTWPGRCRQMLRPTFSSVASHGIAPTTSDATATSVSFREANVRFLVQTAATGLGQVRVLTRPEL